MKYAKIALFAVAWFAYGFGVLPAADAAQPGAIYHYDYPQSSKDALHACIIEQGGSPGTGERAGVWDGVTQSEINACQHATVWVSGKWDWDSRILVSVEP